MTAGGRVVVTGSSGLVGRALVATLAARGVAVTRLVRRAPVSADESGWDPPRGSMEPSVLDGASAVVHLAGAGIGDHRWSAARRQEIRSSRVTSTTVLAGALAAAARPPTVLVSASAVGYYGDRGDEELTEDSPPGTGFLAEVCRAWEEATRPAADAGVRVARLRSGVVLASGGGALARQLPLFRWGLGGRLGSGRQWLSWISLADEVGAILHVLEDGSLEGPVNACAPNPVTNAGFTTAVGRAVHRPAVLVVPAPALRLGLGGELAREMVLASQRVVPTRLVASGYEFRHPTVDAAVAAALDRSP